MMFGANAIFSGRLMHRRYRPTRHELSYQVADVLLDVDRLEELNQTSWLFGYNRKRLFSIHDANHGNGQPIAKHVHALMSEIEGPVPVARIFMLCYPAVLGRVFNPITVYFGLAADGRWVAVVYEVNNTFGQRHSYVLPVAEGTAHRVDKCFYVSPFNKVEGEYRFSLERTPEHLRLDIALFEHGRMKMLARFEGREIPFTDKALVHGLLRLAVQPMKIWAAIHWEALKLYAKGLRPWTRPAHARFEVTRQIPTTTKIQELKP